MSPGGEYVEGGEPGAPLGEEAHHQGPDGLPRGGRHLGGQCTLGKSLQGTSPQNTTK